MKKREANLKGIPPIPALPFDAEMVQEAVCNHYLKFQKSTSNYYCKRFPIGRQPIVQNTKSQKVGQGGIGICFHYLSHRELPKENWHGAGRTKTMVGL